MIVHFSPAARPFARQRLFPYLFTSLICATVLLQPLQPLTCFAQRPSGNRSPLNRITVSITPGHPANRFTPSHALGAGIDGHEQGETDLQLTTANIDAMLSAGLQSLTYRLRTELAMDAWHWNPRGSWSEAGNKQGYWISDSTAVEPIYASYGYQLPRRGNTTDQGNNEGYSRLDDGDSESSWKSNPYLDQHFTYEDNSRHPQWIVVEFESEKPINAARLLWGAPFATNYRIQYAKFDDISDIALNPPGMWRDFPVSVSKPGSSLKRAATSQSLTGAGALLRLSALAIRTRFVRILMTHSSHTGPAGSTDVRDRLGFAIREIALGQIDANGEFHDEVRHARVPQSQTVMHVSSTDPWHRDSDLDEGVEQAGFDRIFNSGLTNNLPVMLPTGLLYDTPENAANEIRYLRSRGFKFNRVELGEEPDGQYATPEDFGALYLQWAAAIHAVDPALKIGGPSFQEIQPGEEPPSERRGNSAWLQRFLRYLQLRHRVSDYAFFSFEWYPFDDVCEPVAPQLARATNMLTAALQEMQRRGLSRRIPWIISEYGYSAYGTQAEISIEGALLNADIVGRFLTLGGDQAFLYGYTPSEVLHDSPCLPGQNMMFSMDDDGDISHRFATYFGARLLTQEWLKPGDEVHEIYPAVSNVRNAKGEALITAYAVHRPDGLWSLLLINKDPKRTFRTGVIFRKPSGSIGANGSTGARGSTSTFQGQLDLYQYSGQQYLLGGPPDNPYPVRADDPDHQVLQSSSRKRTEISLPPYSLTVIRGAVSPVWMK